MQRPIVCIFTKPEASAIEQEKTRAATVGATLARLQEQLARLPQ